MFVIPYQNIGSNLTNFNVVLAFNGASAVAQDAHTTSFSVNDLKDTGHGGLVASAGNDIVACDTSGSFLPFARVGGYDGTTGSIVLRVKVSLSATTNNFIMLAYGRAADTDHSNAASVYSAYLSSVDWGDGTTLSTADATGNGNNATNVGGAAAAGQLRGGVYFSTSSNYANLAAVPSGTNARRVSMWFKTTATGVLQPLFDQGSATTFYGRLAVSATTSNILQIDVHGEGDSGSHIVANGILHKVSISVSGVTIQVYVDGQLDISHTFAAVNTSAGSSYIGQFSDTGAYGGNETFDETQVSGNPSSGADYEDAEYHTEVAPNGFALMLDMATPAGLTHSVANCIPVNIPSSVAGASDITNFRLPIGGSYTWAATAANGGYAANSNGYDIRPYSDAGCTIPITNYYLQSYNAVTGEFHEVVRVSTLSHTTTTTIYLGIGNGSLSTDGSTCGVFSDSVSHYFLASDYSTLNLNDCGSANLPLTTFLSPSITSAYSPFGPSVYFPLGGQSWMAWYVSSGTDHLGAHGYPIGSASRSVGVWFKLVPKSYLGAMSQSFTGNIFGYGNGDFQAYQLNYATNATNAFTTVPNGAKLGTCVANVLWDGSGGGTPQCQGASQAGPQGSPWFSPNNDLGWTYLVSTYTTGGTLNSIKTYINGQLVSSAYTSGTGTGSVNTTDMVGPTCGISGTDPCTNIEIGGGAVTNDGNFYGYIAQPDTSTSVWADNVINANYTCGISPCYTFGTATH